MIFGIVNFLLKWNNGLTQIQNLSHLKRNNFIVLIYIYIYFLFHYSAANEIFNKSTNISLIM